MPAVEMGSVSQILLQCDLSRFPIMPRWRLPASVQASSVAEVSSVSQVNALMTLASYVTCPYGERCEVTDGEALCMPGLVYRRRLHEWRRRYGTWSND